MSERPRVDVAVLTWNTAEVTVKALRELLDSDQGCDIKLLVRDNASSDGTVDALRRDVPEADIDAGTDNIGFAAGVNTLIRRSTAPWFFMLNSDAWPLTGAIGRLVEAARAHPRAAAVAPRIEYPDGRLQHTTHPFPSVRVAATVAFKWNRISADRADELFLEGAWAHDRPRALDWAHGAALLIPRRALQELGGFDERFFFYGEDLEWCWRARKHGWEIWFEPSAVVRHEQGTSATKRYGDGTSVHTRNSLRFYRREHSLPSTLAWWGLNLAGATGRYVAALVRGDRDRAAVWRTHAVAQLHAWRNDA